MSGEPYAVQGVTTILNIESKAASPDGRHQEKGCGDQHRCCHARSPCQQLGRGRNQRRRQDVVGDGIRTRRPTNPPRSPSPTASLTRQCNALCSQVFKRKFSLWSCFSFALSISGIYATATTTFYYPLIAGGAASAVWMWLIGGSGALCLAFSIAELVSSYPTSGGMYFTVKYLVPEKDVPIWAWINGTFALELAAPTWVSLCSTWKDICKIRRQVWGSGSGSGPALDRHGSADDKDSPGWLNLIGQIAGSASVVYGASQMLLAIVSIAKNAEYLPTQGHVTGVMAALTVIHAAINSLSTAWLNRLTRTYAVFHIAVLVAACITLLVMKKDKHSAKYAFTNVEAQTGWTPGFSFLFGSLAPNWAMTGMDKRR